MQNLNELTQLIVEWGDDRGILMNSDAKSQFIKAVSEMGELADAVADGDIHECRDAIGDTYVCLTLLAELLGLHMDECVYQAYSEISGRTGSMINGVFVKDRQAKH